MDANERVILVVGEGTAAGRPDLCDVSLGLGVFAQTAAEAIERVADVAEAVLAALRESGVGADKTQTRNLTVQDWFDQTQQKTTAHVGRYGLTITGQEIGRVGALIAAVAAVAQDALRVDGLHLRLSDPEPLRRSARRQAVQDARSQAAELAEAAGVGLGPLVSIEHGIPVSPFGSQLRGFRDLASSSHAAIEGGSSMIVAHVTMKFQIQD